MPLPIRLLQLKGGSSFSIIIILNIVNHFSHSFSTNGQFLPAYTVSLMFHRRYKVRVWTNMRVSKSLVGDITMMAAKETDLLHFV